MSTLQKWMTDNFRRVKETYRNESFERPECDYSEFLDLTISAEKTTSKWPRILQQRNPKFAQFQPFTDELIKLATDTNDKIRKYILEQIKFCYEVPRRLRQSALTISNYVIQILTKCVLYRDPEHSFC